jgi:hypothetical protein
MLISNIKQLHIHVYINHMVSQDGDYITFCKKLVLFYFYFFEKKMKSKYQIFI